MSEESPQYNPQFQKEVKGVVVGEGNTIYNYYYSQEVKPPTTGDSGDFDEDLPCPYRGLFHFGPNDADVFFGRDLFVDELYRATQTRNFIAVLGASGSGKSSVVLAGLVPKLQKEGHWQFTHFRPGADKDPFYSLAEALVPLYRSELDSTDKITQAGKLAKDLKDGTPLSRIFSSIHRNHPNRRVLLIVDQFEEIYTLCSEETVRRQFLDCLLDSLSPSSSIASSVPVVVITMRADFLGSALSYPPFADALQRSDIKIRAMNREELSEVIEKPVQTLGVEFEEGLVDRILDDVAEQPGNLPLLEFALTELWKGRTSNQLTHQTYEDIGQVDGALARYADAQYGTLTDEERAQVRRIFIQLVRPGEGAEDTRRIAMKTELGEQRWSLVNQLADARLVVTSRNATDEETVEVVHEALIRNWGELREWMETDRVFRVWQERLRSAKKQWTEMGEDRGSLLRGAALAEAEERLRDRPDDLMDEKDFIQQSIQEQKRSRRLEFMLRWGIVAGSLVAVLISSGFGWMTLQQIKQAKLNEAKALGNSSLALLAENKDLVAWFAAIEAGNILQKYHVTHPEGLNALQQVALKSTERRSLNGHELWVTSVSFSPDGKTMTSGSLDNTIKLWNVETGEQLKSINSDDSPVWSVSFSPDGKTVASGSLDNTIKLWNVETGEQLQTLNGHDGAVLSVSFSPDGTTLASGGGDNTIKLWNVEMGRLLKSINSHDGEVLSVSFSPDGKTVASGSADNMIKLWNVETGEQLRSLNGHDSPVNSVSFSPDGKTVASSSGNSASSGSDIGDNTIKLWNVETGKELKRLNGHDAMVSSVSFSPDGTILASSSFDNTIKLWNVETGKQLKSLNKYGSPVWRVSFRPVRAETPEEDGTTLASGSVDASIKLWNVKAGEQLKSLDSHDSQVNSVSFSPDGKTMVSGSVDTIIKLWNVETGEELHSLRGHDGSVSSVSFSPDGKTVVSSSEDNTIRLWNVETGEELHSLNGHDSAIFSVSFSPDGKAVASGSSDNTIKLWNVETGEELHSLDGHDRAVSSVSFSPDGKTVASGSFDNTIKLWNVETGEELQSLNGHDSLVSSVSFSPDGKMLASGFDNTIKLWNVETGEELQSPNGHDSRISSVSFSPDGKMLASGSEDNTVKLWNVETGEELRSLNDHDSAVESVSFSPDGKTLASGNRDNTIKLWNLELLTVEALTAYGCDWVRNHLVYNPNDVDDDDKERAQSLCDTSMEK